MAMIECIGIDIGYSDVKVSYIYEGKIYNFSFPSIVALADTDHALITPDLIDQGLVSYDGKSYYVGELAACVGENSLLRKRNDGDVNDPVWNALLRAAIGRIFIGREIPKSIHVTSGLPVTFYKSIPAREKVISTIESVGKFTMGLNREINVSCSGYCLPQSYATYLNEFFTVEGKIDPDCKIDPNASIGIGDIGEKTSDWVSVLRMSYIKDKADSTDIGMRDVVKIICDDIMTNHGVAVPSNRRSSMIRQIKNVPTLVANGKHTPIPEITEHALHSIAVRAVDYIEGSGFLAEVEHFLVAGGGSIRLLPAMKELSETFRDSATQAKDGVYCNSNGFAKFAAMVSVVDGSSANIDQEKQQAA